jgi:hypothetical protein
MSSYDTHTSLLASDHSLQGGHVDDHGSSEVFTHSSR